MKLGSGKGALKLKGDDQIKKKKRKKKDKELALVDDSKPKVHSWKTDGHWSEASHIKPCGTESVAL